MGHLKLGREPKKGELIVLLVILGFNMLIAFPVIIVGLLIEYTVGAPSIVILVLSVVMILMDLIPVLLSGIVVYFLLSGIYESWGISAVTSIVTGILLLLIGLDVIGWLEIATPYIIDMVGAFIGAQMMAIVMFAALGICLGKCTSNQGTNEPQEQPRRNIGNLSIEAGLRLLVGLGRRVINDSDEVAFDALKHIYNSNSYSMKLLNQSANEIDFDIKANLSRDDFGLAHQNFEVFNERFGKIKKWVYNIILVFIVSSISSLVLLILLLSEGFFVGLILMELIVMLPVISFVMYQFTSRYEHGRYCAPRVSQYNSFLLTNKEFRKRAIYERLLFGLSLLSLVGIIATSVLGLIPSALIWTLISGLMVVIAATFSVNDRTIHLDRLQESEIIERGLKFIGLDEVEEDQEEDIESGSVFSERELPEPEEKVVVTQDWRKLLEQRGHADFAKRVAAHEREVYLESRDTYYYIVPGAFLVLFGIISYVMFSEMDFFFPMQFLSFGFLILGSPILIYGIIRYLKTYKTTRFHKLQRKQLTLLLTHYDITIQKLSDFGSITDTDSPSEYLNFGLIQIFMSTLIRSSIIRLQNYVMFPKEEIEKIWKTRSFYPKLEVTGLFGSSFIFILVYQLFIPFMGLYLPWIFGLFFLGIIGFLILTMVYAIALYYREKQQLTEIIRSQRDDIDVTYQETLDSIFTIIQSEFSLPLRVLFVGNYPQATYTGRCLFTTTGIELKEAVIIPQGLIIDT